MTILIIMECAFSGKSAFICFFRDNDIHILKRWIIIINRASLSKRILSFIWDRKEEDEMVIALFGDSCTGKSSIAKSYLLTFPPKFTAEKTISGWRKARAWQQCFSAKS